MKYCQRRLCLYTNLLCLDMVYDVSSLICNSALTDFGEKEINIVKWHFGSVL